ncbi:serine/threonine protein kinase [Roseiconus nitratireducens]|uniref:Serine/threonine protein kinase n=1 Tax=Roseiconus nitratireducens TaxID=2605748 RepID=A0A5M6D6G2_9BACT|nr:serine/threonine-protein kinase [Roseiconus nitratireducens]KAA5541832.1 serine/threonine protein kinase [Roseiconus nitratireducens]
MNSPLHRFIELLLKSGLVTRAELNRIRSQLDQEQAGDDSETDRYVLDQLAQSGSLTDFQAAAVHEGKSDELILDDYLIIDKIGQGGMGRVFKARHTLMQREVAVKFTLADDASKEADQRFRREVEALSRLVHPNIVSALDAGYRGEHCYLVMEYVEGTTLSSYVRQHGPMTFADALGVIIQAAEGLKYVHRQNIIHRDIKPANLLLTPDRTVKVLDVGLAKFDPHEVDGDDDKTDVDCTHGGTIIGTVDYMAPEQAIDAHSVTPSADVYALGCTLHFLLTGNPPYRGHEKTVLERLVAHREEEIPRLSVAALDVPREFDDIFEKMLSKTPETRYANAGELLSDLNRVQRDYSSMLSGVTTIQMECQNQSRKHSTRLRWLAAISLIAFVAAAGWMLRPDRRPAESLSLMQANAGVTFPEISLISPGELPFDLLGRTDPAIHALTGEGWELSGGTLLVPDSSPAKLLIPVAVQPDYRVTGEVRRLGGSGPLVMFLPIGQTSQCFVLLDSQRAGVSKLGFGFNAVGRLAAVAEHDAMGTETPSRFAVDVCADGLTYYLDDQLIVRWDGDPERLQMAGGWSATPQPAFVIGANHGASFLVSKLRIESLPASER